MDLPDLPDAPEEARLEEFGVGVPFGVAVVGVYTLYFVAPGISMFARLSVYGKIGASIVFALGVVLLVLAGYLYHAIDWSWYLWTEDEGIEEADTDAE